MLHTSNYPPETKRPSAFTVRLLCLQLLYLVCLFFFSSSCITNGIWGLFLSTLWFPRELMFFDNSCSTHFSSPLASSAALYPPILHPPARFHLIWPPLLSSSSSSSSSCLHPFSEDAVWPDVCQRELVFEPNICSELLLLYIK